MSNVPDRVEVALPEEWCRLLEVDSAEPEQDFFQLGGDSLLAMELAETVEQRTNIEFPVSVLFSTGSYAEIYDAAAQQQQ